jgi:hypothetical protein
MKRRTTFVTLWALSTAALAQTNTGSTVSQAAWQTCSTPEQGVIVIVTAAASVIGLVCGWAIFPLTVAPIRYIMQSELDIWGARLAMSLAGGGITGFLMFNFLVQHFG